MANFQTHIAVATVSSAIFTIATSISFHSSISGMELFVLFVAGVISTALPDLDSDTSKPLRIAYFMISLIVPVLLLYLAVKENLIQLDNIPYVLVFYMVSYLMCFVLFRVIMKITTHRGIIHSIPMGAFSSLVVMNIFAFYGREMIFVVLVGVSIFIGFLIHLLLDEVYSVVKFKKSIGSALKLYSRKNIAGTLVLYGISTFLVLNLRYSYSDFHSVFLLFAS